MSGRRRWGALLVLLAAASCGSLGPDGGPRGDWERALALWNAFGPASYSYTVERLCFCSEEGRGPVTVTVTNGVVTGRVYVAGGAAVAPGLHDAFPGVPGLFEILDDALDQGVYLLQVTYDPQTGVPIDFWVDYVENIADEELGYSVRELPVGTP